MTDKQKATAELAELRTKGGRAANTIRKIQDAMPRLSAKNVLAVLSLIDEEVSRMSEDLQCPPVTIVPTGARIPVEELPYDNAVVRLDFSGAISEVEFLVPVEVA